ncbi:MAG TPA: CU044_2847 family protein [Anaerolineales bacterium]|nr:CU044_2847 family protein [Anaerolineales bacterium]
MPADTVQEQEEFEFFVEFPDQEGIVKASLSDNIEKLKAESEKAMNVTMGVIRAMADRVSKTIETIEDKTRPDEMEIEFSIKLDVEGGAVVPMVAKTTAGGQFNIKFKWTLEKPNRPTVLISENK